MRKLFSASLLALVFSLALAARGTAARADAIIEASLGKGWEVTPATQAQQLNFMIAPGISFPVVRLQLGLVADVPDIDKSKFDVGLRPMLTISPPVIPLYARLILAVDNLTDKARRAVAYGGAVGVSVSLSGIGLFAEGGILPRQFRDEFRWVVEGRLGVSVEF